MKKIKKIKVGYNIIQDAVNIANGAYSPLLGFLKRADYQSVIDTMRLEDGQAWSIPIIIDISKEKVEKIKDEKSILFYSDDGSNFILDNIEIYPFNKQRYVNKVYRTDDLGHPGVKYILNKKDFIIGGDLVDLKLNNKLFPEINYSPGETKKIFIKKGWQKVVAFQTRNFPHKSHEFLQKKALEKVDGLFIQPVIGEKKVGDVKDDIIIESYKMLLDKFYPNDKVFLGVLPIRMHYAGPREAIMHALIRRNYGCTHMIIGRDHAGVGKYYQPYEAHDIFDEFTKDELGIEIMKYNNVYYCHECKDLIFENGCNHRNKLYLSGTKIREMIKNKEDLPEELIRKDIADLLLSHPNPFI